MRHNSIIPRIWMKVMKVRYGKSLHLSGWPFIFRFPDAQIVFGKKCFINSNFLSNLLGLYQRTIVIARNKAIIKIGDEVGISGSTIYAREKIEIGNNTIIGANCKIFDNDFHPTNPEARLNKDSEAIGIKPVYIGNNVFIGCNTIILKGTVIGDNCVIGAGSVVHGQFGENLIIAGNPARVIKKVDYEENFSGRCGS